MLSDVRVVKLVASEFEAETNKRHTKLSAFVATRETRPKSGLSHFCPSSPSFQVLVVCISSRSSC